MTGLRPQEFAFVVHGQPVGQNAAWRIIILQPGKAARALGAAPHASLKLSDEGKAYKLEVHRMAMLACPSGWDRENQYVVEAVYYFKTRGSDCDGPGKLVLDALQDFEVDGIKFRGVFASDSQVWKFVQQKETDAEEPRAEIRIRLRNPIAPTQGALL